MHLKISLFVNFTKIAIVISMMILLSGCSSNSNITGKSGITPTVSGITPTVSDTTPTVSGITPTVSDTTPTVPVITHTATCTVPSQEQALQPTTTSLFNTAASVDMVCSSHIKLHIQTSGIYCGAVAVLNQLQSTYDLGSINQINTFLNAFYDTTVIDNEHYSSQLTAKLPPLPQTMQVVPAGFSCSAEYYVTNIGDESVQITTMGMTFTGRTVKNTIDYRSIDDCTLPTPDAVCRCISSCGSGGGCAFSAALDVTLPSLDDSTQKHLDAPVNSICPDTTNLLFPSQLADIFMSVNAKVSDKIYYSVRPTITLNSTNNSGEITILDLPPSFSSTLVFADQSRFSCYGFDGKTFVIGLNATKSICI